MQIINILIIQQMKRNMHSLQNQLMGIQVGKKKTIKNIDYEKVIFIQQNTIKHLQKQVKHLRQYLNYVADDDQHNRQQQQPKEQGTPEKQQKTNKKISGLKGLLSEVMKLVQAKSPEEILTKLKEMEEKANKKLQPVFIERVKEKQVPVIVEKIKQVEKEVQVQKIVYRQKIVEVPVFREKVVEKFIEKPREDETLEEKPKQDRSFQEQVNENLFVENRKGRNGMYKKGNKMSEYKSNTLIRYKQKQSDDDSLKWNKGEKINRNIRFREKK